MSTIQVCKEHGLHSDYVTALMARGVSETDALEIAQRTQYALGNGKFNQPSRNAKGAQSPKSKLAGTGNREVRLLEARVAIEQNEPSGEDILFNHSLLCQVGLPRSQVKGREFQRRVGSASLQLNAGELNIGGILVPQPIPYGAIPRLVLAYASTLALRTHSPVVDIGRSPADFMRLIGLPDTQGHRYGTLRRQVNALAVCNFLMRFADHTFSGLAIEDFEAWLPRAAGQPKYWPKALVLSDNFYNELISHGVPLDRRALHALSGSALCVDIYTWLAYRLHRIKGKAVSVSWDSLRLQFGHEYRSLYAKGDFRKSFSLALRKVLLGYPQAKITSCRGGLKLHASPPPVSPKLILLGPKGKKTLSGLSA